MQVLDGQKGRADPRQAFLQMPETCVPILSMGLSRDREHPDGTNATGNCKSSRTPNDSAGRDATTGISRTAQAISSSSQRMGPDRDGRESDAHGAVSDDFIIINNQRQYDITRRLQQSSRGMYKIDDYYINSDNRWVYQPNFTMKD
jgi:hypothetical protein